MLNRNVTLWAMVTGALLIACSNVAGNDQWRDGKSRVCAVVAADSFADFAQAVGRLEQDYNFNVVFVLPPHAAIGYLPSAFANHVSVDGVSVVTADRGVEQVVSSGSIDTDALGKMVMAWNVFRDFQGLGQHQAEPPDSMAPLHPLVNDIIVQEQSTREAIWRKLTSEYLIGKVALGIFMMESTGDWENWSNGPPNRMDSVFQKIIIGLEWMHDQAMSRGANVEYWFDNGGYYASVPTQFEPIMMVTANDNLWMDQGLNSIGYTHSRVRWNMFNQKCRIEEIGGTRSTNSPESENEDGILDLTLAFVRTI